MTLRSKPNVTAEILAVGSELCFGRIYDTNSFWMADQLTKLGVHVKRITCLTDDIENMTSAIKDSLSREPTFLFLSGGLGPTDDDLTIEALSQVTAIPTRLDNNGLIWMAEKEKVPVERLDKRLTKMAMSLVGAKCLRNPVGWAPITHLKLDDTEIFALPGPPVEMKESFNQYISKIVGERTGRKSYSARFVATMYEEEISPLIGQMMAKERDVYIKPLVSGYRPEVGLPLEILVFSENDHECQQKMRRVMSKLSELVSSQGKVLKPSTDPTVV